MAGLTAGQYTVATDEDHIDTDGVKRYVALLTQSGTDAPVATVLQNTLGGTPVWTRQATGQYILTLASAFIGTPTPLADAILNINSGVFNGIGGVDGGDNFYEVKTYANADLTNPADDILSGYLFSIAVYPV